MEPDDPRAVVRSATAPAGWENPSAAARYDLVVLGGGAAGLVCAAGAAGLGARVALVERARLGGECLHTGCVPSKALLRAARAAAEIRRGRDLGVSTAGEPIVDYSAVVGRVRRVQAELCGNDSAERFQKLGVDLFFGEARFAGPEAIEFGNQRLRFRRAVICTGSRPHVPEIPGLESGDLLTSETVLDRTELPRSLLIAGAGATGCEMAQAFARLGSRVILVESADRILPREDPDASRLLQTALEREGVVVMTGTDVRSARREGGGWTVELGGAGATNRPSVDEIFLATGRRPNVETLNLAAAGVETNANAGVTVDDFLRTANPRIYAAGDVCTLDRYAHTADAMARVVLRNAFFFGRQRMSRLPQPRCVYTSPEIAQIGLTEGEAAALGRRCRVVTQALAVVDRAVIDGAADGVLKLVLDARSERLLGATLICDQATALLPALGLLLHTKAKVSTLGAAGLAYPTLAGVFGKITDGLLRERLTRPVRWLLRQRFRWLR